MTEKKENNQSVRKEQANQTIVKHFNTILMKKECRKEVFLEKIKMSTDTVLMPDGRVYVYPCSFDRGKLVTVSGNPVRQQGVMLTKPDGECHFKPFQQTGAKRFVLLYATTYARVKRTRRDTIIEIRIPDSLPEWERLRVLAHEMKLVSQFLKSQVSKQQRKEAA